MWEELVTIKKSNESHNDCNSDESGTRLNQGKFYKRHEQDCYWRLLRVNEEIQGDECNWALSAVRAKPKSNGQAAPKVNNMTTPQKTTCFGGIWISTRKVFTLTYFINLLGLLFDCSCLFLEVIVPGTKFTCKLGIKFPFDVIGLFKRMKMN